MTTELLAPAGGQEALVAAVQSGADAVYMGFGAFNARRSARNFSDEEFRAAVSYCHLRGVKVYLTLNTLVTDRELPALAAEARTASECGVDAILVQDWGVLATLQKIIPDVRLHASTISSRVKPYSQNHFSINSLSTSAGLRSESPIARITANEPFV